MTPPKKPLPPPDTSGTTTMAKRFTVGANPLATPTSTHTQPIGDVQAAHTKPTGRGRVGTRPDAEGMTRESYYITKDAAEALTTAVDQIRVVLGPDTPKHVAISAIIATGAAAADQIAAELAEQRAAELAEQLAKLRS